MVFPKSWLSLNSKPLISKVAHKINQHPKGQLLNTRTSIIILLFLFTIFYYYFILYILKMYSISTVLHTLMVEIFYWCGRLLK